jgi:NAD(P)-dependent dehydrogenase (short-subunit alcohol dehydrogenase family)
VARNATLLEEARTEILANAISNEQKVVCVSLDVAGPYQNIQKAIVQTEEELGPIYFLACNAGYSKPGKFEDIPIEQFKVSIHLFLLTCCIYDK